LVLYHRDLHEQHPVFISSQVVSCHFRTAKYYHGLCTNVTEDVYIPQNIHFKVVGLH